jgi:uncharacterized protein YndB with AHSA1/START domain
MAEAYTNCSRKFAPSGHDDIRERNRSQFPEKNRNVPTRIRARFLQESLDILMRMKRLALLLLLFVPLKMPAAASAEKAIDREVLVNAPVAKVWQAWTTTDGIKTFFAPDAHVELRVDGPFEIFFNPYAPPGQKGADGMRIIGFQNERMLSFTWNAPPDLPEARKQRTIVILRFEPQGDAQTRVILHHVGWGDGGEWDKAFAYFSNAWPHVLQNLQESFSKGPKDWTQWLEQMKKITK